MVLISLITKATKFTCNHQYIYIYTQTHVEKKKMTDFFFSNNQPIIKKKEIEENQALNTLFYLSKYKKKRSFKVNQSDCKPSINYFSE